MLFQVRYFESSNNYIKDAELRTVKKLENFEQDVACQPQVFLHPISMAFVSLCTGTYWGFNWMNIRIKPNVTISDAVITK